MVKAEWIPRIRANLPGYMRYTDFRSGDPVDELDIWLGETDHKYRVCRCTHCGESFTVDADDRETMRRELWTKGHNDTVECPNCYATLEMKNEKLMRGYKSMAGKYRTLIAERLDRDHVKLHAYYIEYGYNSEEVFPELYIFEDMIYDLRPGEINVKRKVAYSKDNWETVGIREPWPLSDWCNSYIMRGYTFDADELMHDTWLQYLPYDKLYDTDFTQSCSGYYTTYSRSEQTPWGRLMCYAALYPQLEYAAKIGAMEFVVDLVMLNRKNSRLVNWRAKTMPEFFRCDKKTATEIIRNGCKKTEIELIHYRHLTPETAKEWCKRGFTHCAIRDAESTLGDPGSEIVKYLIKQGYGSNGVYVLQDYRGAAQRLGRDMSVPGIRLPKNLAEAHDEATKSAKALTTAAKNKAYKKRLPTLREKYEYITADWMAIVPGDLNDIKREGRAMHHCVGGYIDRHAEGQCTIIFIRHVLSPRTPQFTVELDANGKIKQIQGYHNEYRNKPSGAAADFVDEWQAEINRRLAKHKNKKHKERATA